jgi:hypothetical protein
MQQSAPGQPPPLPSSIIDRITYLEKGLQDTNQQLGRAYERISLLETSVGIVFPPRPGEAVE